MEKKTKSKLPKPSKGKNKSTQKNENYFFCNQPKEPTVVFDSTVSEDRAVFIINHRKPFANGTPLKYYFMDGTKSEKEAVREGFQTWKNVGIGLTFTEVDIQEASDIRISFEELNLNGEKEGSWSKVGREILEIPKNRKTMNIGWSPLTPYGRATVLHEIGHTLGLHHEHQNPNSGIEWNVPRVYEYFSSPPNKWSTAVIDHNVLNTNFLAEIKASEWDPKSIMQYPFPAGLILKPEKYKNGISENYTLSKLDKEWVKLTYPPLTSKDYTKIVLMQPQLIDAPVGGQSTFMFIPDYDSKYTIQTFGSMDSVMVLFLEEEGVKSYLSGDDNSGTPNGSVIEMRLLKGKKYIIAIRVMYRERTDNTVILILPK